MDETNYLETRPLLRLERVEEESSKNETDMCDAGSKSVKRFKSDSDESEKARNDTSGSVKSDAIKFQKSSTDKSDITNLLKYDNDKSDIPEKRNEQSVIETENQSEIDNKIELRRSDRIKRLPGVSYNEYHFEKDFIYCA